MCSQIAEQNAYGGDNLVDHLEELQEQSRLKVTDESRRFIEVDIHEAMQIGELKKNSEAIKWSGPISTERLSRTRSPKKEWTN